MFWKIFENFLFRFPFFLSLLGGNLLPFEILNFESFFSLSLCLSVYPSLYGIVAMMNNRTRHRSRWSNAGRPARSATKRRRIFDVFLRNWSREARAESSLFGSRTDRHRRGENGDVQTIVPPGTVDFRQTQRRRSIRMASGIWGEWASIVPQRYREFQFMDILPERC